MHKISDITTRKYDSSCIQCWMDCPKQFYYRYIMKWEPKIEPAPLVFGRLFHDALYLWYTSKSAEECLAVFQAIPKTISDEKRTREHAEVIFKGYIKKYPTEPWTTRSLEVEFALDMPNGAMFTGRIDKIIEWEKSVYVLDHKTASQLGLTFFRSFRPKFQIDGYCYACRELSGSCAGAVINGILVAKAKVDFARDISSRTVRELDSFPEQFTIWTDDMERGMLAKRFPMNTQQCNKYGECVYKELCVYGEDGAELRFDVGKEA